MRRQCAAFILATVSALALANSQEQPQIPTPSTTQLPEDVGRPPTDEYPAKPPRDVPPSASPTSVSRAAQHPVHTFTLGGTRITPVYLDTGPSAAAEELSYWNPKGQQFAVVTAQVEPSGKGSYCGAAKISLRTDTGAEYSPARLGQSDADVPVSTGQMMWSWAVGRQNQIDL